MFQRALSPLPGGGSGKIFTKSVKVTYVAGTNTLTFSDFTEIYAIRLGTGNYVTAYIDENGNLQNSGGYASAMRATGILGNVVTIEVSSGFEGDNDCIVTGK